METKIWNCENEECIKRSVKRSKEIDFLFHDDMVELNVKNGIVSISTIENNNIHEDCFLTNHFQEMFNNGLLPDNCECGVFYLTEDWNVIGNFIGSDNDENDIDYFIEINN